MPDKHPTTGENNSIQLAVIAEQVKNIKETTNRVEGSLRDLQKQIDDTYATKAELQPIKSIVYGLVGLVLTAVIGSVVFLVIK